MKQEENFKKYIESFAQLLALVLPEDISTEIYCKKYLSHLLQHKAYYLEIYADLLNKLTRHSVSKKENITLIDYGAGNGLLGIFAKFCGFNKVYINDRDSNFILAAQNLATQIKIKVDGFITGEIKEVKHFFKNELPDAIVGTDVIEHIYDPGEFLQDVHLMNDSIVSVFTTASNPENYFKVKQLQKMQLLDEYTGGNPEDHLLFGDQALEPFIKIREKIIRKYTDRLTENEIIELAKATRGLNEQDILTAVDQYNETGSIRVIPAEGTNTCNPLNGSWTERILSIKKYRSMYHAAGFDILLYNGFYNEYENGIRKLLKKSLNAAVKLLGRKFAPYIIMIGIKK